MALVNPNIAMSFRGVELPQQNALADYAAIQQIQGGRQAQELNALKMQEYERARTEEEGLRNYLAQADLAKPDTRANLLRYGKTGLAYGEALAKQDTAALTQREAAFKVQKAKGDFIAQAKRDTSQNPSDANLTAFKEDLLANPLFTEPEKLQLGANIDRILTMPVDQRRTFMASQGASASELKPVLTPQNLGGTARILSTPAFGGASTPVEGSVGTVTAAPAAPPVSVAEFERAKTDPAFMKFLQDRAAAGRAPAQPPAPTITSIVNPLNPNEMITVDARRYQGGGAGSPGVIGVAGKEPGAALRQNKAEAGKTQLADDLDNLRTSFLALDKMRAIPSTERNVLSNIGSATAASGVGQMLGRAGGTEAQVERDVINSARTRLVNSIKNATGMSAQQLNSNVELQTMLKSISDPGQSVQAALRIIGDIEDAYVKGDGKMPKRGAPAAGALSPAEQAELDQLRKRFGGK